MIWDKDASEPERRAQLEAGDPGLRPATPSRRSRRARWRWRPSSATSSASPGRSRPRSTSHRSDPDDEPTDAPVLVVSGEMDDVTTPHEGKVVADEFPDSTYFVERNAGHTASLYDHSGPSAVEIRRFLREALGG